MKNNYDMLKITLSDTYSNLEDVYRKHLRKYKNKRKKTKMLEEDIATVLNKYQHLIVDKIDKNLKTLDQLDDSGLQSTWENDFRRTERQKRMNTVSSNMSVVLKDSERIAKYNKQYKVFSNKELQIVEINKVINDQYQNEIKGVIIKKLRNKYK